CIGDSVEEALLKSLLAVGQRIPETSVLISSGDALQKADLLPACQMLAENGYTIYATEGTCKYLCENGVPARKALWPSEKDSSGRFPRALDLIKDPKVDMVVNIQKNFTSNELTNGYKMRRAAIDFNVPLFTNSRLASAFIKSFCTVPIDKIEIKSWDEYR
ncbi:MAG: carbamoyl phosphate synthase large subunit, partial [Bacteroidales bacterium]|nr:carbamoyl phosphate synthase large subunit [Bacteroidales bacterium]